MVLKAEWDMIFLKEYPTWTHIGAMGLKIQFHKNNMGQYSNYKTMCFHSLTFLDTCALDFICAIVFVIRTYRYVNFISMVVKLTWAWVNPLLVAPFPFWHFPKPWFFLALIACDWPCHSSKCNVITIHIMTINFIMWTWLARVGGGGLNWLRAILISMKPTISPTFFLSLLSGIWWWYTTLFQFGAFGLLWCKFI